MGTYRHRWLVNAEQTMRRAAAAFQAGCDAAILAGESDRAAAFGALAEQYRATAAAYAHEALAAA